MLRIITDTSPMLTVEQGKALNIDITPLSVTINGKSYREYADINAHEFNELVQQKHVPMTSQPAVGEVMEKLEQYPNDDILIISMAKGLSGTYESCESAKIMDGRKNIEVINSQTLCGPHNHLIMEAIRLRDENKSLQEITEYITNLSKSANSFLIPQDFDFLKRGGRLTPLAATLGGLLKIQPVLIVSPNGERLEKFTVGRNFESSIKKILAYFIEHNINSEYKIYITHAFVKDQALKIKEKFEAAIPNADITVGELSCAFITQGGPQCIAIQYIKK